MKGFIAILFYLSLSAHATLVEDVYEFNQGSCWIKEHQDQLKIVDFISSKAKFINYGVLFSEIGIINEVPLPGLLPKDYQSFIHCNSTGVKFILNTLVASESESYRLCLHYEIMDKDIKLVEKGILKLNETGPCEGSDPYKLISSISNQEDFEKYIRPILVELMKNGHLQNYILNQNSLILNLAQDKMSHLSKVEERLKTSVEKKYLRYLERNMLYLPIGEFIPLDN